MQMEKDTPLQRKQVFWQKEKTEASQENDKFPLYFLLKDQPSLREDSKRPGDKSLLLGLQW